MMYVAYGSNMNLEQMKCRCPNSHVVGNGIVSGWQLVFNIHADIIETNDFDDKLPVVVWEIADDDWSYLDMYEGYPTYYIKRIVPVEINGEIEYAIAYVMSDTKKGVYPPSESYFDCIVQGYMENGIYDVGYLYDALEFSYDNQTEYNQYTA